jgi:hypothetical protein
MRKLSLISELGGRALGFREYTEETTTPTAFATELAQSYPDVVIA